MTRQIGDLFLIIHKQSIGGAFFGEVVSTEDPKELGQRWIKGSKADLAHRFDRKGIRWNDYPDWDVNNEYIEIPLYEGVKYLNPRRPSAEDIYERLRATDG